MDLYWFLQFFPGLWISLFLYYLIETFLPSMYSSGSFLVSCLIFCPILILSLFVSCVISYDVVFLICCSLGCGLLISKTASWFLTQILCCLLGQCLLWSTPPFVSAYISTLFIVLYFSHSFRIQVLLLRQCVFIFTSIPCKCYKCYCYRVFPVGFWDLLSYSSCFLIYPVLCGRFLFLLPDM